MSLQVCVRGALTRKTYKETGSRRREQRNFRLSAAHQDICEIILERSWKYFVSRNKIQNETPSDRKTKQGPPTSRKYHHSSNN
mmetsp:Transcript_9983/g.12460  ORF Transcript_9983/g.12460 Transcript_9983/m.12460 type:complete len:83 (-) Transcript_9983:1405-1653(-)